MAKKIKYDTIFCDIDETLVDSDYNLSLENIKTIKEFSAAGGRFIPVTGRNYAGIKKLYKQMELSTPVIISQGVVFDPNTNETLYYETMDKSGLIGLCEFLEQRNLYFQLFCGENIFVECKTFYSEQYINRCDVVIAEVGCRLSEWFANSNNMCEKVMIECDKDIVDDVVEVLNEKFGKDFYITKSKSWVIEITSYDSTKGAAIRFLCSEFEINPNLSMAIGDSYNDLTMFDEVGLSVAVRNSPKEIQQYASVITDSNDNSGVATAIKRYAYV